MVNFKYCRILEVKFITIYQRIESLTDQNLWDGKGNIQHRNQHHNNVSEFVISTVLGHKDFVIYKQFWDGIISTNDH